MEQTSKWLVGSLIMFITSLLVPRLILFALRRIAKSFKYDPRQTVAGLVFGTGVCVFFYYKYVEFIPPEDFLSGLNLLVGILGLVLGIIWAVKEFRKNK